MGKLSWVTIREPDPDREYVLMLTYLPLKKFSAIPRFRRYTRGIQADLQRSPGIVGFGIISQALRRRFWTLSAWEDDTSLMNFVYQLPHNEAIKELKGDLREFKRVRWTVPGTELPPDWDDALARLKREAR